MANNPTPNQPIRNDNFTRQILTITIAVFSLIGIILLGFYCIRTSPLDKQSDTARYVLATILPVIGTWMGAVIAFYFGNENFRVANQGMQDLVKSFTTSEDKLKSLKATDNSVMIPLATIKFNPDIASLTDDKILIKKDLINFITTNNKGERLPVQNEKNVVRYIVHKSSLNDFAVQLGDVKYASLTTKKLEEITLDDMIKSDAEVNKTITMSAAFVSKLATLFDAQQMILNNPYCQDVFITENGSANEPIIGWITNNIITELAKV